MYLNYKGKTYFPVVLRGLVLLGNKLCFSILFETLVLEHIFFLSERMPVDSD